MAKYDPLFEYLCRSGHGSVELGFDDIGRLVGGLPASPERHGAWWSNDAGGRHVQANAWLNAGRLVVAVDRDRRRVTFSPPKWRRGA